MLGFLTLLATAVPAGETARALQPIIDEARARGLTRLVLENASYAGPVEIAGEFELVGAKEGTSAIVGVGKGTVVRVLSDARVTIEGLEIRGARVGKDDRATGGGGGIVLLERATATLRRVVVSDCEGAFNGSAVNARSLSTLTIEDSEFRNNRGPFPRPVSVVSISSGATAIIRRSVFLGNHGGHEISVVDSKSLDISAVRFGPYAPAREHCQARMAAAGGTGPEFRVSLDGLTVEASSCPTLLTSAKGVEVVYRNMEWPDATIPENALRVD